MSDLEITVRYKSLPAKILLSIMTLSMPVWGIIVPIGLLVALTIITPWFLNGHYDKALATIQGCSVWLAVPCIGILTTLVLADNRLIASKSGISFPLFMLPFIGWKRQFPWAEVRKLLVCKPDSKDASLVFLLENRLPASLRVDCLPEDGLEQLLLAADLWGEKLEKDSAVIELHQKLQSKSDDSKHLSYTAMWEDEMSRRFSSTAFMPLEPGKTLQNGQLKVVRQLAFGGLSAIYLAQRSGKDLVVIKESVIPSSANADARAKAAELFDREARLLTRLADESIARVLDYFVEDARNYIILEYISGMDLRELVKQRGAQSEIDVLLWASQICRVLQYLHAQDPPIIHRDLTPDNLVLRDDGRLKLIDFGAANEFVGTATGTLVGKQSYIAPEQFRGKSCAQSDIYALGCTLYFLVCGRDPEALCTSHPKDVCQVSDDMDRLIAECTALELDGRPGCAAAVRARVEEILSKASSSPQVQT